MKHWPNTQAIACKLGIENHPWNSSSWHMRQPGFTYFESKFGTGGELNSSVNVFKSARLFDPVKITDLAPDSAMVEDLKAFPFLHGSIAHLQQELPTYLAAAEGVSSDLEPLKWWKKKETTSPYWAAACQQVLLCQ